MEWQMLWWLAWVIPMVLVCLVVGFVILAPALGLIGAISRLFEIFANKVPEQSQPEPETR
jgi:hypothetical protein